MTTYKNELVKRQFYGHLKNAKGFSPKTIDCFEKAIWLWEDFTGKADFANFNKTKAEEFKEWLKSKKKVHSEGEVSLSFCYGNLRHLKTFFEWLSKQSGYKSKINQTAIDYLNLTMGEIRTATQPRNGEYPALEDIKSVIEHITGKSEVEMRDKALISLTFLTGARIAAIISLSMQCFDKKNLTIHQDPTMGVWTKNSKNITTAIVPFSYKEPLNYFLEWFDYLEKDKKFQPTDPIFPATKRENGADNLSYYSSGKVEPTFWKNTTSPRKIFEKRFAQAGIKYYHPHTFRHLLVKEISKLPLTEEQKKAFSQNLGHENMGTTFGSYGYGRINDERQIEIIRNINFDGRQGEVKQFIGVDKKEWEELRELIKNKK
ncbi:MAG: site-specific integrase [Candidatus Paceibacterota bacterium]